MRGRWMLGFAAVAALGCGGKFVPVSGKVTLNGQPLVGATVVFQPIAEPGSIDPGPGSQGKTNEKGEFTLKASTGENGAVVGTHRVMISLLDPQVGNSDERAPRGGWPLADKVPSQYNSESTLKFVVAPGGKPADFPLTSP